MLMLNSVDAEVPHYLIKHKEHFSVHYVAPHQLSYNSIHELTRKWQVIMERY